MIYTFLLVLFFLLFIFLLKKNLLWGLILISAFLPSYLIRYTIFGLPTTVLEGMILLTFVAWVIKHSPQWGGVTKNFLRRQALPYPFNRWFWAIVLFLMASLLAVFTSSNHLAALGIWRAYFLEPILFFSVFISTVKTREEILKIIWALILGAIPAALLALAQEFTGWLIPNPFWQDWATRRVTSFWGYPNAVSLFFAPLLPFVVYLFEHGGRKTKGSFWHDLFYSLIFFLFFLDIIFARSMGGLTAVVGTLLIFGLFFRRTRKVTLIIVIIAGCLAFLTPLKNPLHEEFFLQGISGNLRTNMWGETVEMLRARPFLGAGLAAYQSAVAPYHILNWAEIYLYPHDIFLNFWSETGLLGLIAFLWLVLLFGRAGWDFLRSHLLHGDEAWLVETLLASMSIILIQGLVDVPYFKNDLAVFFWILMGLMTLSLKFSSKYAHS